MNTAACAWDGGDCCESTCVGTLCGVFGYNCKNPSAADLLVASVDTDTQDSDEAAEVETDGDTHVATDDDGDDDDDDDDDEDDDDDGADDADDATLMEPPGVPNNQLGDLSETDEVFAHTAPADMMVDFESAPVNGIYIESASSGSAQVTHTLEGEVTMTVSAPAAQQDLAVGNLLSSFAASAIGDGLGYSDVSILSIEALGRRLGTSPVSSSVKIRFAALAAEQTETDTPRLRLKIQEAFTAASSNFTVSELEVSVTWCDGVGSSGCNGAGQDTEVVHVKSSSSCWLVIAALTLGACAFLAICVVCLTGCRLKNQSCPSNKVVTNDATNDDTEAPVVIIGNDSVSDTSIKKHNSDAESEIASISTADTQEGSGTHSIEEPALDGGVPAVV